MQHGAAVDFMDEAWWVPASVKPDGMPALHIGERSKPGSIIVDRDGQRYFNEAVSYMEAALADADPQHVSDLELILRHVERAVIARFADGEIAITNILPILERTLYRLTTDNRIPSPRNGSPTKRGRARTS